MRRMRSAEQRLEAALNELDAAQQLAAIVEAERAGAEDYWRAVAGTPLRWAPRDSKRVPQHWLFTQPRESYRTGNRYGATDPFNALLNYGYTLLEAETRIACLTAGLHPGLGLFHQDKDGRASFVYDAMEPCRGISDRLALEFIRGHTFHLGECWETREGFCRLDPDLAGRVVHWAAKFRPPAIAVVRDVVNYLSASATVMYRCN